MLIALLAAALIAVLLAADSSRTPAAAQVADPSCGTDLAMVVDSSGSVDDSELDLMRDALSGFVNALLPATPSELALVEFDRSASVLTDFTDDVTALEAAIAATDSGGRTNWQDALLTARGLFPNRANPDVIVFASDGRPNKVNGTNEFNRRAALDAAIAAADEAKAAGIRIIAIGIGDRLRVDKLEAIASSPDDVFTTDFDQLAQTLADLADDLCVEPEPSCGADIAMVIDSSGSVDATELGQMQDAFSVFVNSFLPGTPTEMAVVDFDRIGRVLQDFTDDIAALETAIEATESGGRTNWQDPLMKAAALFPHRAEAPDIIVFSSDGRPNKINGTNEFNRRAALEAAVVEADAAKAAGVRIIAIGIGDRLRVDRLQAIASSPADVFTTDFDRLAETLADLADDLCDQTIIVNKLIDADGSLATTDDQTPGEGWTFTATATSGSVDPGSADTDAAGSVVFTVGAGGATVDISETLADPYTLLSASCDGARDNGVSNGVDTITGVVVGAGDTVVCTFINTSEETGT